VERGEAELHKKVIGLVLGTILVLAGAVYGGTYALVLYVVGLSLAFISVILLAFLRDVHSQ